ncbi:MAG: FAD-dependent monooxygenase [Microbispora sp.]|nr:FAD-dependent monooxygenase [Microbispora sp.]
MYDVIVVGARCAGASTALLLARAGYRVLVLERARKGTDKLSTLYIHRPGVALLARWGVLDAVTATGCPPLTRQTYTVADVHLDGPLPEVDGDRAAYAPRRHLLDAILCDAAAAAGATVRHGCTVHDLVWDGDRVAGVRYRAAAGRTVTERAELVVGADGMRSTVAGLAGAAEYAVHPRLTCAYYTYWAGVSAGFEQYQRDGQWVGVIPTNDDQVLIAAYFRQREFDRIRGEAAAAYQANIEGTAPGLRERLREAEQTERLYGTGDQRNFLRTASGPGWALVGDAGHHKDSLTARGITEAFLQADLLADCLAREPGIDAALAAYRARRDDLLLINYRSTLSVARLDVAEERLRMLRRIQHSPALTERYFAATAGLIDPADLLTDLEPVR